MIKPKLHIYSKFLFTYLAVIIILLLGTLPVYSHYADNLRQKETDKVVRTLEAGIKRLEETVVDLSWAITSLEEDFTYRRLTSKSESLTPRELYAAIQVQKSFAGAVRNISLIDYAFLSFLNNDIIIDLERVYRNSDNFYGTFLHYTGQDFTNVDDIRAAGSPVLPCQPVTIRTRSTLLQGEYVTLMFSGSFGQNTQNALYAFFERGRLLDLLLSPGVAEQGALLIRDMRGQEILNSNPQQISLEPAARSMELIERDTALLGLSIRVAVPDAMYVGGLWNAMSMVLLFALVALFFSTLAAFLFAYRNTKPIKNTLKRIREIGMGGDSEARDAFGFINRALDTISMDCNKLSTELQTYQKRLRHQTIENLLNGYVVYADDPKIGVHLHKRNRLLLFGASKSEAGTRFGGDWVKNYGELESFVALNLVKAGLPEGIIVHETEERDIAVIIPGEDEPPWNTQAVGEVVEGILETLNTRLNVRTCAAISQVFDDPNLLVREFVRAKNALEAFPPQSDPMIWLPEQEAANACPDLTPTVINQIYELLMMGAYDHLMAVLDIVFTPDVLLSDHFKQAYYSVRGRLLTVLFKIRTEDRAGQQIPDYDPKKSSQELLFELRESCRVLCGQINRQKVSHNSQLVNSILAYINQNYADSQLSATAIARRFNISSKYMSQFIKSQTGRTYSEYLENVRLEHALQLLKKPDINVMQIANSVGFANQNTFYKAFKRVYKVSPSTWRSSGSEAGASSEGEKA